MVATYTNTITQETITGQVPYAEYRNDQAIHQALDKKQLPKRSKDLPGQGKMMDQIWSLMEKCWDHNPVGRPDAASVYELVRCRRYAKLN
jgi:diadenosine tetraphosphatase ApaH/serine/threonine PP2A family protein phosphatase